MASKFIQIAARTAGKSLCRTPGIRQVSPRLQSTAAQILASSPSTNVSQLDNGLRVATEDLGSNTITLGLWIDAGSRYESEESNGAAHFVEHLSFKGTMKRSQADLEAEVEKIGATLHAYTTRDKTVFYAKCLSKDAAKAVDLLADVVLNAKFEEGAIERERKVILKEVKDMEKNMQDVVMDHLHSIAYQGTPLGRTVIGPTKNIKAMSKKHLTEYVGSNFKAPRMVLAAAGGVDHAEIERLAKEHFGSASKEYKGEIPQAGPCRYTGSEIRVRNDDMPFVHVALAVEAPGAADPDFLPLSVATALLGSWDRSHGGGKFVATRLASQCFEYKLCETYRSFNIPYKDTGLWGVYFVGDHHIQDDMIFALQQEWMRLCTNLGEFETERGKNLLRARLFSQLDNSTAMCEAIGRQMLVHGKRISPAELEAKIRAIDAKAVKDACMKYVYDKCPVVAGVGPTENLPDYNVVRASMYWLRL